MKRNSCGMAISLALALMAVLTSGSWFSANAQDQSKAAKDKQEQTQPDGQSQDKTKTGGAQTQQASDVTFSGTVTGGDRNVLTVTDAQKTDHKVTVTTDTKIMKAGKAATASDLKPNDQVTVTARPGSDGALTAVMIEISGE